MKIGTKVLYRGKPGRVVARRPKGMVDVQMEGTGRIERRSPRDLTPVRTNGGWRKLRSNPTYSEFRRLIHKYTQADGVDFYVDFRSGRVVLTEGDNHIGDIMFSYENISALEEGDCWRDAARVESRVEQAGGYLSDTIIFIEASNIEPHYRRRGFGRRAYAAILLACERFLPEVVLLVGDECIEGSTSEMAARVYRSLSRDFIGEELILSSMPRRMEPALERLRRADRPNPRRRRQNPSSVHQALREPPSSWRRMFRAHGLPTSPSVKQVLTLLEKTPSGRSAGPKGRGRHAVPARVKRAAWRGIVLSHKNNYTSKSGIGLARAFQLATQPTVSTRTIERMAAYFSRHASDKNAAQFGNDIKPSRGYMAWLNWGGDAGESWANHVLREMKKRSA